MDGFPMLTVALVSLGFGIVIGIVVRRWLLARYTRKQIGRTATEAEEILASARQEADMLCKEKIEDANKVLEEGRRALEEEREADKRKLRRTRNSLNQRRSNLNRRTRRLNERQGQLNAAGEAVALVRSETEKVQGQAETLRGSVDALLKRVTARQAELDSSRQDLAARKEKLTAKEHSLEKLIAQHVSKLEEVAGLTAAEAQESLRRQLVEEAELQASVKVQEIRDQAKLTANKEARRIVLSAIQRTAAGHTIENTVSVVTLESGELKGRIIGREGRNIRAFEAATGIEVIVDDTPGAVVLSGFDPVRREIARISLDALLKDGRIHPARIEKVVRKTAANMEQKLMEIGERTVIDLHLHGLNTNIVRNIGRMRYRSSYGQNLLAHSTETARIASLIAAEMGLDTTKALRAGLLHDIGKVLEDDTDKPHALAGMDFCRRYKEAEDICNAIGAHHDEIEMTTLISPVVQAADAISGARPGARRESEAAYIKRLEDIESIASSFEGVDQAFAIHAGRELRVMVNHESISEKKADQLAHDISQQIEKELRYPGQIKVMVIREVRSVAYAK